MIKKREDYRPFAPSVTEERVAEFFDLPVTQVDLSFMLFAIKVKAEFRTQLGGITHLDGTARVQTVAHKTNPRFWSLLNSFSDLTGFPVLLNTSFNNNIEPIVDSIEDAITCFLTTGLDFLVVGDYLISKRENAFDTDLVWCRNLVPQFACGQKLLKRNKYASSGDVDPTWALETTSHPMLGRHAIEISEDTFSLLTMIDGKMSFAELFRATNISEPERVNYMMRDVIQLWHSRVLCLTSIQEPN